MIKFIYQNCFYTIFIVFVIAGFTSCTKEDAPQTAEVVFWTNAPITGLQIDVTVEDSASGGTYTGSITQGYEQANAPDCGSPGCYTLSNLKAGTYYISGTDGVHSWGQFPNYSKLRITSDNFGHCSHSVFTY